MRPGSETLGLAPEARSFLTRRQRRILRMRLNYLTSGEIAKRIGVTPQVVQNELHSISRQKKIRLALDAGGRRLDALEALAAKYLVERVR